MDPQTLDHILFRATDRLDDDLAAIVTLAHQVTAERIDHPDAREHLRNRFGDAGLIELAYAMNGAALLPGIKRTLGYATTCDIELMPKFQVIEILPTPHTSRLPKYSGGLGAAPPVDRIVRRNS